MISFTQIAYEIRDGIALITLNRPDRLNAWTPTMEREMKAALRAADGDDAVDAVIITGAGRAFCAGADLKEAAAPQDRTAEPGGGDFDQRYTYILAVGKPVIAAINGAVAGVGLCITLFCDWRFMAQGQKLTTAFAKRGLIAEHGSAWMLQRLIGTTNALDLLISGRTLLTEEAASMGLVRSVPADRLLETAEAFARRLVDETSPRSRRVIKAQVYEAMRLSLGEAVAASDIAQRESLESADFKEGIEAFREGRAPNFPRKQREREPDDVSSQ
jgi:enoyl-CoA hydratase/carnithine racemase